LCESQEYVVIYECESLPLCMAEGLNESQATPTQMQPKRQGTYGRHSRLTVSKNVVERSQSVHTEFPGVVTSQDPSTPQRYATAALVRLWSAVHAVRPVVSQRSPTLRPWQSLARPPPPSATHAAGGAMAKFGMLLTDMEHAL